MVGRRNMWATNSMTKEASDSESPPAKGSRQIKVEWLLAPLVLGAAILLWDALVRWQDYPSFILPAPGVVARKFLTVAGNGILWYHT